jgi:hypothetical protein
MPFTRLNTTHDFDESLAEAGKASDINGGISAANLAMLAANFADTRPST